MMSKLTAQDNNQNKQFKPKIYESKWRGYLRNYYGCNNYDQRNYQNRYYYVGQCSFLMLNCLECLGDKCHIYSILCALQCTTDHLWAP